MMGDKSPNHLSCFGVTGTTEKTDETDETDRRRKMKVCAKCKHWDGTENLKNPYGSCRLKPPVIIDSIVRINLEDCPDDYKAALIDATNHPQTAFFDWCGEWDGL